MKLKNTSESVIDFPYGDRHSQTVHIDAQGEAECPDEVGKNILATYPFVMEIEKESVAVPQETMPEPEKKISEPVPELVTPKPREKMVKRGRPFLKK